MPTTQRAQSTLLCNLCRDNLNIQECTSLTEIAHKEFKAVEELEKNVKNYRFDALDKISDDIERLIQAAEQAYIDQEFINSLSIKFIQHIKDDIKKLQDHLKDCLKNARSEKGKDRLLADIRTHKSTLSTLIANDNYLNAMYSKEDREKLERIFTCEREKSKFFISIHRGKVADFNKLNFVLKDFTHFVEEELLKQLMKEKVSLKRHRPEDGECKNGVKKSKVDINEQIQDFLNGTENGINTKIKNLLQITKQGKKNINNTNNANRNIDDINKSESDVEKIKNFIKATSQDIMSPFNKVSDYNKSYNDTISKNNKSTLQFPTFQNATSQGMISQHVDTGNISQCTNNKCYGGEGCIN